MADDELRCHMCGVNSKVFTDEAEYRAHIAREFLDAHIRYRATVNVDAEASGDRKRQRELPIRFADSATQEGMIWSHNLCGGNAIFILF